MNSPSMIIVLLLLNASNIPGRRYRDSDESFENLVVYKDCKYKETKPPETTTTPAPSLRVAQKPTPCAACCNMCCNLRNNLRNQYGDYEDMMGTEQNYQPQRQAAHVPDLVRPVTPPNSPVKIKKKKKSGRIAPVNGSGRRDMGQAREHIKVLLSRDEEMKKILRELVRVTIQKVGLLERMQHMKDSEEDSEEGD